MSNPDFDSPERTLARASLLRARAAIDEALRQLDGVADEAPVDSASPRPALPLAMTSFAYASRDTPMTLEDLDVGVLEHVIASLPEVFDTYHVVEHPDFRAAHAHLLDRPALNQLAGKVLRRNAPVLRLAYLGPRGRRRSALWQRQEI